VTAISKRLAADPGYEFSPTVWVEIAAALPLLAKPGTTYHYSNIGYIVAGLAAERPAARAWRRSSAAGSPAAWAWQPRRTTRTPRSPGLMRTATGSRRRGRSPTRRA